jgi:hypothetical protein
MPLADASLQRYDLGDASGKLDDPHLRPLAIVTPGAQDDTLVVGPGDDLVDPRERDDLAGGTGGRVNDPDRGVGEQVAGSPPCSRCSLMPVQTPAGLPLLLAGRNSAAASLAPRPRPGGSHQGAGVSRAAPACR